MTSIYFFILESIIFTSLLCFESINCIKFSSTLFFLSAFLNNLAKALFEFMASEPPFKITTFPDLKQRLATSEVTFGLLS